MEVRIGALKVLLYTASLHCFLIIGKRVGRGCKLGYLDLYPHQNCGWKDLGLLFWCEKAELTS